MGGKKKETKNKNRYKKIWQKICKQGEEKRKKKNGLKERKKHCNSASEVKLTNKRDSLKFKIYVSESAVALLCRIVRYSSEPNTKVYGMWPHPFKNFFFS